MSVLYFLKTGCSKNDVKNIWNDGAARFKIAQLLYIVSVAFSCYMSDMVRWLLFLAALFIIDKEQRRACGIKNLNGISKIAAWVLIIFAAWVVLIPLFFGDESLLSRIRGLPRPLEIIFWIWGAFVFAKDEYFFKKMYVIFAVSCIVGGTALFLQRFFLGFLDIRQGWLFEERPERDGLMLLLLLPWLLFILFSTKRKVVCIICFMGTVTAIIAMLSTYYSTIWCTMFAEFIVVLFVSLKSGRKMFRRACLIYVCISVVLGILVAYALYSVPGVMERMNVEYSQLSMAGKNMDSFTNNRVEVWKDAIRIINIRPIFGYGWVNYNDYAVIKNFHQHSTYLQAAFCLGFPGMILLILSVSMLSYVCFKRVIISKCHDVLPCIVAVTLTGYVVAGLPEAFFFVGRELLLLTWVPFALLLLPTGNNPYRD